MKQLVNVIVLATIITFFGSCKKETKKVTTPTHEVEESHNNSKKDCNEVHWSHHKGENGPENWKNLCDGFADCGGKAQSPIDITTKTLVTENKLIAPKFNYGKSKIAIINNGHTVQFNITSENKVSLNGKEYKLLQFHYHALSEHTVDGKHFPIEVHFVHQHSDTDFAVIGVLFEEGKENALFSKYLANFPTEKGNYDSEETFDILNVLPTNKSYYNYSGSLTTPPCSEVVNWYVLKTPLTASKKQIEVFSKILHDNYRPVQPINNRKIASFNQ